MLDELAKEFTSGLARVGRKTVRSFFYSPEDWLDYHTGAKMQDYLDWLVLIDIMQNRVKDEGLLLQEVPFERNLYNIWLKGRGYQDSAGVRSDYLAQIGPETVKECQQGMILRPAAPMGQSCSAIALLLPVAVDWDESSTVLKKIYGPLDEPSIKAISKSLAEAFDLDIGLEPLSEYRCRGCQVDIYPKLVGAGDFDDLFGQRYQSWLRSSIPYGNALSRTRMPKAKAIGSSGEACVGLAIGVYGCVSEITKLTTIKMEDSDTERISEILRSAYKLASGILWCSETLAERGSAEDECMSAMGVVDGEFDDDSDEGGGFGFGKPGEGVDMRLASLIIDPIDLEVQPTKPRGVILPFTGKRK